MTKTEIFLNLYKQLEAVCSNELGFQKGSAVVALSRRADFRNVRSELDYIREVRNLLTHKPLIDDKYAVEPTDAMIELLEDTIKKIQCPLTAEQIMVPMTKVLYATYDSNVLQAMETMYKRAFTHLPILYNSKVVGVFSHSTLMNYILSGSNKVPPEITFSDIKEVLSFDQHPAETYRFIKKSELAADVSDMFDMALQKNKKIRMVFVTEHGNPEEKLLGIITPWDVIAALE